VIRGAQPIRLEGGERAVLLLHGFGDTPQSLAYLASELHQRGWSVSVPLLPGHGRTLHAFAASRAPEWLGAARQEYRELEGRFRVVAVVGQSMGGALATVLASETPTIPAIVLLAPYLSFPTMIRRLSKVHRAWAMLTPWVRGRRKRSILDPVEEAKVLGYGYTTPRLLVELGEIVRQARLAAPRVTVPTLVIQSRQDNRIPSDAAERAFALFTVPEKRIVWTEGNAHVVSVDFGREHVAVATAEWLEAHAAFSVTAVPDDRAPESR
jgi:carboxylesterase